MSGKAVDVAPVTVDLPLDYQVTFSWPLDKSDAVRWSPRRPLKAWDPRLRFTPTHEKFWKAYRDARRDFLRLVANALGEPVTVQGPEGVEVIRPFAVQ